MSHNKIAGICVVPLEQGYCHVKCGRSTEVNLFVRLGVPQNDWAVAVAVCKCARVLNTRQPVYAGYFCVLNKTTDDKGPFAI